MFPLCEIYWTHQPECFAHYFHVDRDDDVGNEDDDDGDDDDVQTCFRETKI